MKSGNIVQAIALRLVALLVMMSGMALGLVVSGASVAARGTHSGDTTGYSISLVASSTDYYYTNNTQLTATLSYPASNPPTITTGKSLSFSIDGQIYESSPIVTETSPVVIFVGATTTGGLLPGQHTVTASYTDLATNTQVTSSPVTLTVEKLNGSSSLDCQTSKFVAIGQTMQFTVNLTYSFDASNWTNATITIKFVGPTTVVSAPQVIDHYAYTKFSVPAPTQAGNYQIQCIFSGNSDYTPGQQNLPLTVSNYYGLSIKLYSDPSPLNLNTKGPFTLYLVLQPGAGVPIGSMPPIPTGQVYFQFGNGTWGPETLKSDGTLLTTFKASVPFGNSLTEINVQYDGDTNYAQQNLFFQQALPPIPGSTGGSGSGKPGSGATATPTPNATVTATVTTTATATTQSATGASNSPTASASAGTGPNWALIVGLIVALLALIGGGAGGFLWLRSRRARLAPPPPMELAQGQYGPSSQYPQHDTGWNGPEAPTYPDQS